MPEERNGIEPPSFRLPEPKPETDPRQTRTLVGALVALVTIFVALLPVFLSSTARPMSGKVERLDLTAPAAAKTVDPGVIFFAPVGAEVPSVVSSAQAEYTAEARRSGCEGYVRIQVGISPQGQPFNPQVVRPLGCENLDGQALKSVMNWRFQPARLRGAAVPASAWVDVRFQLTKQ